MYCPKCGSETPDPQRCNSCGWSEFVPVRQVSPSPSVADDPTMRLLLPVGRSLWAIAAGYLGLFSVLFLPAPLAVIAGMLALRDIRKNPKLGGSGRAIFGVIMGSLFSMGMLAIICMIIVSL